jgi:hypothetical protein
LDRIGFPGVPGGLRGSMGFHPVFPYVFAPLRLAQDRSGDSICFFSAILGLLGEGQRLQEPFFRIASVYLDPVCFPGRERARFGGDLGIRTGRRSMRRHHNRFL